MPKNKTQASTEIKADMKILIEIERPDDEGGTRNVLSLGSYVEEVMGDDCLLITLPIYKGSHYLLPRNKPILAYFFIGLRMFSMSIKFLERIVRDELAYAKVQILSDLQPNQRRDCYRLQCLLPVTAERILNNKNEPPPPITCEMVNFSDGGMLFATNEAFEIGETITLTFDIGKIETVVSEVLRVENPYMGIYRYNIAVKFLHECKLQKQRFYRYIVTQQRQKLRQQAEENSLIDDY